jgi:hypothetical protein
MRSNSITSTFRKNLKIVIASLFAMILVAGCSSTKITSGQILVDKKLSRPGTIWVHDFVASPSDIQADTSITEKTSEPNKPLTPEELQIAQQLGKSITTQLVQQINAMGLHAKLATSSSKPQVNDIVLRGYLYSIETGNAAKRIFIGFGYGTSVLNTMLEGYQMTTNGLRKLSSADLESIGEKMPGGSAMSVPSFLIFRNPIALILGPAIKGVQEIGGGPAIESRATNTASKIADALKVRFLEESWISQKTDN